MWKDPNSRETHVNFYAMLAALAVFVFFLCIARLTAAYEQEKLYEGDVVGIHNTVLCDTQEQLVSILEAQQESIYSAIIQYRILRRQYNEIGEPSCAYIEDPIKMTIIRVVARVHDVPSPNGTTTTLYAVAVLYTGDNDKLFPGYIMSAHDVFPPQRDRPV